MSGVIDRNGVQWERCNNCLAFVKIQALGYEQPSEQYPHGRDLCPRCARGSAKTRAIRRVRGIKAHAEEKARYENTLFPSACGHEAKSKDQVYHWQHNTDGSSTATIYCSEECKHVAGH